MKMEQNSVYPDSEIIADYKKMLSVLKKAEKLFKEICEKKEGINCHSCPLNIEKHSDLGEFQICLFFGLNDAIKTLKKEIKTAEIEVKNE